ncbi:MAG: hypothetical protein H8E73_00175, partial [Planctomycetes bacterium]|nr:hypothetical protein [Planctomycetota bacterium]
MERSTPATPKATSFAWTLAADRRDDNTGFRREPVMRYLNGFDYGVIVVYFAILVSLGLYLRKKASSSLEEYFLGGRRLPWWALGISGMASFLDITGTMMVISFLYMLGPRGLYIAFRGGAVLVLAVMLLWIGKRHRRSGWMTRAEGMSYRLCGGGWGRGARINKNAGENILDLGMKN